MVEEPVEGHYVIDVHGDIHAVKGLNHPPDRIVAVPKYIKARDDFHKLTTFQQAINFLEESRPSYLFEDRFAGQLLPAIPKQMLLSTIKPNLNLPSNTPPKLRDAAQRLVKKLKQLAPVDGRIGYTGSLLLGLASQSSDIDLVVYGMKAGEAVREAMAELRRNGATMPAMGGALNTLLASRKDSVLKADEWKSSEERKLLTGTFDGHLYTMKLVPDQHEYWERYGDRTCRSLGHAEVVCKVVDDCLGIYTPNLYQVEVVDVIEGPEAAWDVVHVISMRSRFAEQCFAGEEVLVRARLEEVRHGGRVYYRMFVGNSLIDYILLSR